MKSFEENDDIDNHGGFHGRRQSNPTNHMVDKGSLRLLDWDRADDRGNGKKQVVGWPSWDGSQEPALMGSEESNIDNAKRTNDYHSKRNQVERVREVRKRGWNESDDGKEKPSSFDGNDIDNRGEFCGWKQSDPTNHKLDNGSLSLSCLDRADDCNGKKQVCGWPSWDGSQEPALMGSVESNDYNAKRTIECFSKSSQIERVREGCKRVWNESDDGRPKRRTSEAGNIYNRDEFHRCRRSNPTDLMVDKGSLSLSYWDRADDGNGKKRVVGLPSWDGSQEPALKCSVEFNDDNAKRKKECFVNRNQVEKAREVHKRDWTKSDYGKEKRRTFEGNNIDNRGGLYGRRQSDPTNHMADKGSLSLSYWNGADEINGKKEVVGWPSWDGARSQTNGKSGWDQSCGGWSTSKKDPSLASKRASNESGYGKAKLETFEGGDSFYGHGFDGSRQSKPRNNMVNEGILRNSACWDGNGKDDGGWPSWDGVRSKIGTDHENGKDSWNQSQGWTTAEDPSMALKNGWNYCEGIVGCGQSNPKVNMKDEGSFRKSVSWDRSADSDGRKESGGWPSSDLNRSKTVASDTHLKVEINSWNQSQERVTIKDSITITGKRDWHEPEDCKAKIETACWDIPESGNDKKESGGWCSWDEAMSKSNGPTYPINGKTNWNALDNATVMTCKKGWTDSEEDREKRELIKLGVAFDGIDGWRQPDHKSNMVNKCSVKMPANWDGNGKKESSGCPSLDEARSKAATDRKNGNVSRNHPRGWTASEESSTALKNDWNDSEIVREKMDFTDGDVITGYMPSNPNSNTVDKGSSRESTCWDILADDNKKKERDGWLSWDEARLNNAGKHINQKNGKDAWNQSQGWIDTTMTRKGGWHESEMGKAKKATREVSLGNPVFQDRPIDSVGKNKGGGWHGLDGGQFNIVRKRINRSYDQIASRGDTIMADKGRSSKSYKNSSRSPSRRGGRFRCLIGDTAQNYSERDIEGFKGSNNARYRCNDRWTNSDIPSKQSNNLQDKLPSCHESHIHRDGRRNDSSYDGCTHENTGMVSSWNSLKNHDTPGTAQVWQQHTMICEGVSCETIRSPVIAPKCYVIDQCVGNSQLGLKFQQNYYICQQNPQNTVSLPDFPIQAGPNMLSNSQLPCRGGSNLKHEAQHSEQKISLSKSDSSHEASRTPDLACQGNRTRDTPRSKTPDVKALRMFKCALAEFVKNTINPAWKEGRLSKEAHNTVVKKVVDKVISVVGSNIPPTQEHIGQYMSFANNKLQKLTQEYLDMFINT